MYGSIGAAWGAFLPLLALLLVIPPLFCAGTWCPSFSGAIPGFNQGQSTGPIVTVSLAWAPYLDNADEGTAVYLESQRCRPKGSPPPPPLRLTGYAFPAWFDPATFPNRALFACVLARSDGTILAVRLAQPIHGGAADRELVAAIRDGWRFEGAGGTGAGWERVRLNQGAPLDALLFN